MSPAAHILTDGGVRPAVTWAAVVVLAMGGAAILRGRGTVLEAVGWAGFGVSAATCGTLLVMAMRGPVAPPLSLSLLAPATPARATAPLQVTVCAQTPRGTAVAVPDGDHLLAVSVDGTQVSTELSSTFAVLVPSGDHLLRVELVTADHQAFSPAVAVEARVSVVGTAPISAAVSCPQG